MIADLGLLTDVTACTYYHVVPDPAECADNGVLAHEAVLPQCDIPRETRPRTDICDQAVVLLFTEGVDFSSQLIYPAVSYRDEHIEPVGWKYLFDSLKRNDVEAQEGGFHAILLVHGKAADLVPSVVAEGGINNLREISCSEYHNP